MLCVLIRSTLAVFQMFTHVENSTLSGAMDCPLHMGADKASIQETKYVILYQYLPCGYHGGHSLESPSSGGSTENQQDVV